MSQITVGNPCVFPRNEELIPDAWVFVTTTRACTLKAVVLVQEIILFRSDSELRTVKCWVLHVSVCVHVGSVLLM